MPRDGVLAVIAGLFLSTPALPALVKRYQDATDRSQISTRMGMAAMGSFTYVCSMAILLLLVSMHLAAGSYNPFIYFRF